MSGRRTDSASRLIKADAPQIYRALLDEKALAAWLPPQGMSGRYRMTLTYLEPGTAAPGKSSANEDVVRGRFLRLIPDREVVQVAEFDSDDPDFAGGMTLTWSLHPSNGDTEARVVAENVPLGVKKEDHDAGLASSLANLAAYLER